MDKIAALLPVGQDDLQFHRGARRRTRRFALNADVVVHEPCFSEGVTLNASVGGLRIAVDQEIPVGSLCVMEVHFTADNQSTEFGRVVWSMKLPDGWVLGLAFEPVH